MILPLAAPGIVASGIYAFTLSWNEFLLPLLFNNKHVIGPSRWASRR